jgi:phage gpG-like protein
MPRNKLDLDPLVKALQKQKKTLPIKVGEDAVRFFRRSFRNEGFTDRTLKKWKDRKYPARGGAKTILKVSGALMRSIKRLSTSFGSIKIGTRGVTYAQIHNEGGTTNPTVTPRMRGWARHKFKKTGNPVYNAIANTKKKTLTVNIPQRQYIGRSYKLEKLLMQRIEKEISNFAKNL